MTRWGRPRAPPLLPQATAHGVATEDKEDNEDNENDETGTMGTTTTSTAPTITAASKLLIGWIAGATTRQRPNVHATCPSLTSNCSWGESWVGTTGNTRISHNDNDAQQHPQQRTQHQPHAYEQSLVGWIIDAAWLQCQACRDKEDVTAPSTRPPPVQALARRVDWVLTVPSPPP